MRGNGAPGPELVNRTGGGPGRARPPSRIVVARWGGALRGRAVRVAAAGGLAGVLAAGSPGVALAAPAASGAAGAAPAATVGRTGSYLTDDRQRTVVLRGMSVPAGVTPTAADLDTWVADGFTGVRLAVPVASGGRFPAVPGWPDPRAATGAGAAGGTDPGLAQAVVVTRLVTARGLRVVLRLVPTTVGRTLSTATLTAGLAGLAARLRDEPGLLGYEVPAVPGDGTALMDAVAARDPHHLLWRERPAPFDAAARVAVNDPTGYLTGWKDGSPAALAGLVAAADTFGLSWFYDPPAAGGTTVTTGGPGAAGATPPAVQGPLVRPYPEVIAGTPEALRVDPSGTLTVAYRPVSAAGTPVAAGAVTAISVPAAAYPNGYRARVSGARVTSAPGSGLLCVVALPGAARVQIEVRPAVGGPRVTALRTAGAAGCTSPPAGTASAVGGAGGRAGSGVSAAGHSPAADGDDEYSGPLLWVLPLAGAAATAGLLAAVFRPWRRRGRPPSLGPTPLVSGTAPDGSSPRAGD